MTKMINFMQIILAITSIYIIKYVTMKFFQYFKTHEEYESALSNGLLPELRVIVIGEQKYNVLYKNLEGVLLKLDNEGNYHLGTDSETIIVL